MAAKPATRKRLTKSNFSRGLTPRKRKKRTEKKKNLSFCMCRVTRVTCFTTTLALINCKTAYFPFSYSQAYKKKKKTTTIPKQPSPKKNTPDYPNLN